MLNACQQTKKFGHVMNKMDWLRRISSWCWDEYKNKNVTYNVTCQMRYENYRDHLMHKNRHNLLYCDFMFVGSTKLVPKTLTRTNTVKILKIARDFTSNTAIKPMSKSLGKKFSEKSMQAKN